MIDPQRFAIRVISLTSSHERRLAVSENLRGLGLSWEFFDGLTVDSQSELEPRPDRQLTRFGRPLTKGEVGCFKSHFATIAAFSRDPRLDWLLVLEDDVWLDTAFPFFDILEILEHRRIPYLRLFARRFKPADVILQHGQHQLIRFRTDPYGAQAYIVSRAGAGSFIRSVKSIDMPIDDEIGRFWRHGLEPYAIFPFPAVERYVRSSLQHERDLNPMNIRAFTLRRHTQRVCEKIIKTGSNLAFRVSNR
jgi:glycosyl transferase family 25